MSLKVRNIEQYGRPFAMEATRFNFLKHFVNLIDLDDDDLDVSPDVMMDDGIACISCIGTVTKYGSGLGPSTIAIGQCVRQKADDPNCSGIMMVFDTPGGAADGMDEMASEITAAGVKKPVWGFADGWACGAGYWAFAQCQRCIAGPVSIIGSIGSYGVLYDRSEQFEKNGIKVHVVKAGEFKGSGISGTKITNDQLDDQQRVVNQLNEVFVQAVAKGRKIRLKKAAALSDGRVHVGAHAKALGLVDEIGTFDDAMAGLRAVAAKRTA